MLLGHISSFVFILYVNIQITPKLISLFDSYFRARGHFNKRQSYKAKIEMDMTMQVLFL